MTTQIFGHFIHGSSYVDYCFYVDYCITKLNSLTGRKKVRNCKYQFFMAMLPLLCWKELADSSCERDINYIHTPLT